MSSILTFISKELFLLHNLLIPVQNIIVSLLHVTVSDTDVRLTTAETGKGFSSLTFAVSHQFLLTVQSSF